MPYTPPTGNAVELDFGAVPYTPPTGDAVVLDFADPLTAIAADSAISLAQAAALTTGVELVASASFAIAAAADVSTGPSGAALVADAAIVFAQAADLTAQPAVALAASSTLTFGTGADLEGGTVPIEELEEDLAAGGGTTTRFAKRPTRRVSLDLDLTLPKRKRRRREQVPQVQFDHTDAVAVRAQERSMPDAATAAQVIAHNRAAIALVLKALEM